MNMICRQIVDALMEYLEQRLPPDSREAFEAHLAICPRCVEFLKAYRAVSPIIRRATETELPSAMQVRLRARIAAVLSGGS